ncbi:hypothetical protein P7K49_013912 [Saguinus oedipus]|uniref:Uncharacterized protein n=1 Tax=Saguinus oedipus TaxID=9490 RepID=A0ABQ9VHN1_SAGOE|nr:hypothetical protein P7K49_013912 [Saguinus oedipus]
MRSYRPIQEYFGEMMGTETIQESEIIIIGMLGYDALQPSPLALEDRVWELLKEADKTAEENKDQSQVYDAMAETLAAADVHQFAIKIDQAEDFLQSTHEFESAESLKSLLQLHEHHTKGKKYFLGSVALWTSLDEAHTALLALLWHPADSETDVLLFSGQPSRVQYKKLTERLRELAEETEGRIHTTQQPSWNYERFKSQNFHIKSAFETLSTIGNSINTRPIFLMSAVELLERSLALLNKSQQLTDFIEKFKCEGPNVNPELIQAAHSSCLKIDSLLELLQDRRRQLDKYLKQQWQELSQVLQICQWDQQENQVTQRGVG